MNVALLLKIARTHLLTRIKQTVVATLGVTFGIGTFIILVSFMTGLNNMLDGLVINRTPHIHIYNEMKASAVQPAESYFNQEKFTVVHSIKPKATQLKIHNAIPLMEHLSNHEKIYGVTPQVVAQVFYMAGSVAINGVSNGINVANETALFNFQDYVIEGNPMDLQHIDNSIILGTDIARKLYVGIGDRVQITTPRGDLFNLKIVGIYQSGIAEIDKIQSYVALKTAQILLGENDHYITDINVKLHDLNEAPALAKSLSAQFNLTATDIQTANAQFETGTSIRNLITYAVSITLLVVAGFGIYNVLNMLIYEKMSDIAILKATGYTGNDVLIIFISQAIIIGIAGGITGLLIGYGASVVIDEIPFNTEALPTIKTYPVNFNPVYYIIGIIFALVSTFLAGYLPARKAHSIDPVEIIRGQ